MTTPIAQIITDAYRVTNLINLGTSPNFTQQAEGLRYLSRIVLSSIGNEIGEPLEAFPIGRKGIKSPPGYPWWDQVPSGTWFVPKNYRLMLNLEEAVTLPLNPNPDDGSRFAIVDVSGNLSTNNVTVVGNGRLIEGSSTLTINEDGFRGEWIYQADLGEWKKCAPIEITGVLPFPPEFDDYFVIALAMRLNPSYAASIDPQTLAAFQRSQKQIRARYHQVVPTRPELALIRMPRVAYDRDLWSDSYWLYDPVSMWDRGWPF